MKVNALKHTRIWIILSGLVLVLLPLQGVTQQSSDASKTSAQGTPERDRHMILILFLVPGNITSSVA